MVKQWTSTRTSRRTAASGTGWTSWCAGAGRGRGGLDGAEVDELVDALPAGQHPPVRGALGHRRTRRCSARLSTLVGRARSAVTGSQRPAWKDLARFFVVSYPAALYRSMRWWAAVGVAFALVGLVVGAWVAGDPQVQATIAAPEQIRQLVEHDFEDYYSSAPAGSFAAQVATNNAWVAALALALGVFLLPVVWILWQNALNVGIAGGLMAANDRLGLFFGLILPHGLLELTCVFVAAGAGLRLGWSWIDPGAAHPVAGAARGGPGGRRAGHRAGGDAVRLRRRRGVRDAVRPADLGPDRHRRDRCGSASWLRRRARRPRGPGR